MILEQGATIADRAVTVTYADNYELPPEACKVTAVNPFSSYVDYRCPALVTEL